MYFMLIQVIFSIQIDAHEHMWVMSQNLSGTSAQHIHQTADSSLGALGHRRRTIDLPRTYAVADDVQLHHYDVASASFVTCER